MALPFFGFTASAARRGAVAAVYAAVAFAAVWLVEGAAAPKPAAPIPVAATSTTQTVLINITATYPVARWTVQVLGTDLAPTDADARHWRGSVPAGAVEVFVQADAADTASDQPCALRLTVGEGAATRQMTAWGEGSVAVVWRLDADVSGVRP